MIPKIIIQTWKDETLRLKYCKYVDILKELCPDFEYLFFNNDDVEKFVSENFPEYVEYFNSFEINIQKYDFFRLLAVYFYGGFYIDIDFELTQSLSTLCENNCVFPKEYDENNKLGYPFTLGNYCFGSSKNNEFIKECILEIVAIQEKIKTLQQNKQDRIKKDFYVFETTGPLLITNTFFNFKKQDQITLLEGTPFQPYKFGYYGTHHMEGSWKEHTKNKGGADLVIDRLKHYLPEIENYNLITSINSFVNKNKTNIYYFHDLPDDNTYIGIEPTSEDIVVFVSEWQKKLFEEYFKNKMYFPEKTFVVPNNIIPIPEHIKHDNVCKIIYHTTPHRGLNILVDVYPKIIPFLRNMNIMVHLDVYSSLKIYNRDDVDIKFEPLYDFIKQHPNMTYHGYVSNEEIRKALQESHIFAYPSIFCETSCLCMIEAMSAGCLCVHSSLGSLPETSNNMTFMYDYTDDYQSHCTLFAQTLLKALNQYKLIDTYPQRQYIQQKYGIENVIPQWKAILD
tara:strand:+ start:551 stop:2077 length:1527 start_codon:yes stop_codon:yes gene_type:complete